jgi:hypothetical protein
MKRIDIRRKMNLKKIVAPVGSLVAFATSASLVSAQIVGDIDPGAGYASNIGGLIEFILRLVLAIGALLVFGYLILGGIEWITSGGDKGKTEGARNKITSAVIGLIVLAASYAILNLALGFLGLGSLEGALNNVGTISGDRTTCVPRPGRPCPTAD